MKVNLDQVILAIDAASDTNKAYYYIPKEEIVWEDDDDFRKYDYDDLIPLPDRRDIDDYGNMERFINRVNDEEIKEWLSNAIRGRGAFRMFRAALERFHMLNDWYDYRDRCHRVTAMDWCEENGIEYEGPRYIIEDDYDDLEDDDEWETIPEKPAAQKTQKTEFKIISIGRKNINQLVFLSSAFIDEQLVKNHQKAADDPDEALNRLEDAMKQGYVLEAVSDHGRFIGYSISHENDDTLSMDEIFVRKDMRRKGAGRLLVNSAEKKASESGTDLKFEIMPYDRDMIAFLKKCGYDVMTSITIGKSEEKDADSTVTLDGISFFVN
ncbi:MAG: UPF0158 family protein [Erysipelotrichaceae bacterium]|nr:UPF0158 family protein [Erysipelotrichaceae bacterium]